MNDTSNFPYIHGFSHEEQQRLRHQARAFEFILYRDVDFYKVDKLLEVGCGVGAQTEILLRHFPEVEITAIDLNDRQLNAAKEFHSNNQRVTFQKMNAKSMNFDDDSFDAAFLCWVLEHIPQPQQVVNELFRVIKKGGKVVISEVMNSTFFLDPYSPHIWKYWMAFNDFQFSQAGDPFVGAKLGNFLSNAGFADIVTTIKSEHRDARSPELRSEALVDWRSLMLSAKDELISAGCINQELVEKVEDEFDDVMKNPQAIVYYSFMQAQALKPH